MSTSHQPDIPPPDRGRARTTAPDGARSEPTADGRLPAEHATPAGPAPTGTNGMALAAVVIGTVALAFGLVPFLGAFVAIPLGILAITLGVVGRQRAGRTGQGGGQAVGGLVSGILAIVVALILGGVVLAGLVWQTDTPLPEIVPEITEDIERFELER